MELEEQVVSLELAKRLKELGVKQESYFFWYNGNVLRHNQLTQELRRAEPPVSAFTVAELGEMLPGGYASYVAPNADSPYKWKCIFPRPHPLEQDIYGDTEADARAKMLVYLLESNLISHGKMEP